MPARFEDRAAAKTHLTLKRWLVLARKLFDNGILSVLTSGAAIGVGWKLNFYTGGTSSRITTYNARTAGSANANPVIANASGRFGPIWIEEGQTIKWVLTDENNANPVTVDNVLLDSVAPDIAATLDDFIAGSVPLPVASGGTGSTSAANAAVALAVLPLAGGTMTGNIVRSGKGAHAYFSDAAMTKPVIFITASASADPRSGSPGEIWLKY